MSRVYLQGKAKGSHLIVGLDPALSQWFYQVWFLMPEGEEPEAPQISSIDECRPGQGPSKGALLETILCYAEPNQRREIAYNQIALDLDPGDATYPADPSGPPADP